MNTLRLETLTGETPPPVLLLGGPTASGKSGAALALAKAWGSEIVNADSMQVYADLRVLTARPSAVETAAAPHHLYGVVDAAEAFSVGRWLSAALDALDAIAARGRPAIVVGGTGLYLRALFQGLAQIPPIPTSARREAEATFAAESETGVRARLALADAAAEGRIAAGDRQRLVRALEVLLATGRPLSHWQAATAPARPTAGWRRLVLEPPRETLHARARARLEQMVEAGAADEAARLMARGLDPALPAMKAVGLAAFSALAEGRIGPDEAVAQAGAQTRAYIKRQLTWFRHQAADWERLEA